MRKRHLNAFLRPAETRRSTLSGLFGNFNGIAADDVEASIANSRFGLSCAAELGHCRPGEGSASPTKRTPRLLQQEESLFEYEPGQSTRGPSGNRTPTREATSAALSGQLAADERRRRARKPVSLILIC